MSKKHLTKKRKKKLLQLFAVTSMVTNVAAGPINVMAEQMEDTLGIENSSTIGGDPIASGEESEETVSMDEVPEEAIEVMETTEEKMNESIEYNDNIDNTQAEEETDGLNVDLVKSSGSYQDGGTWSFDTAKGILTLNGGTIDGKIGAASWLKKISKSDILEVNIINSKTVSSVESLFYNYSNVKKITFDNYDTSQVTSMYGMFWGCSNLTELDLSGFNTRRVTAMSAMFNGCKNLSNLNLSSFDTRKVKRLNYMFRECSKLRKLDLSNFDTSQVITTKGMFQNCSNLSELDLSNFDTSNVSTTSTMFYGAPLAKLTLGGKTKLPSDGGLRTIRDLEFWYSEGTNSYLNSTSSLVTSHNKLGEKNTYIYVDRSEEIVTLSFDTMGGAPISAVETKYSTLWTAPKTPTRVGYQFMGWYTDAKYTEEFDFSSAATESKTVYAKWEDEIVILDFDTVGGSPISSVETKYGDVWIVPEAPTKEGYQFMGWYTDAEYTEEFDFSSAATESKTVYAKWEDERIFVADNYHIGEYNITGHFSAPIVTAQLRINGVISNKGGTFNHTDGTFYYYVGAGRIQMGQEVVLEGLDKSGNIVETVKIEPKVAEGMLSNVQYTVGSSTITGTYMGEISQARLVVNGNIVSVGGVFKDGTFSYYVNPNQVKENDAVQLQGYDKEGKPVGDLTPVTLQKQQGQITEATYKLGQSTITGTYEGTVKKARLLVDGKQISWGGTFKEGIFNYYVTPGIIKVDSKVELLSYGEGDELLSQENFSVTVLP